MNGREEGRGPDPERSTIKAVAAALAMAAALITWPAEQSAALPQKERPEAVVAKGTKKTKTKSRTTGFGMWRRSLAAGAPRPTPAEIAIRAAHAQLGKPYRWAAMGPNGFDCSGLVGFAYGQAGITLPRSSRSQYAGIKRVAIEELRPGDLVFSGGRRVNHVGIYIGDGKMIHSPHSGRRVEIAPLRRNLLGAGRPTV